MVIDDDVFGGSTRNQVYSWLNLWTSFIGVMSSLITIILIYRMKVTTGHIYLVLIMSIYQLGYDLTLFFSNVWISYYGTVVADVFQITCGIGGALVSNWIALIVLYIVLWKQRVGVFENAFTIHLTCLLPGIVTTIVYLVATVPKSNNSSTLTEIAIVYLYNNIRLLSIFLNFVFVFGTAARVFRNGSVSKSPQEAAIRTLFQRMIWYPVVQAVGRSGYAWYEIAYGYNIGADDASDVEYGSMIFIAIITPSVSVCYLIIFLVMQPHAYQHLICLLTCTNFIPKDEDTSNAATSFASSHHTRPFTNSDGTHSLDFLGYSPEHYTNTTMSQPPSSLYHPEFNKSSLLIPSQTSSLPPLASHSDQNAASVSSMSSRFSSRLSSILYWTQTRPPQPHSGRDMRDEDELYSILEGSSTATGTSNTTIRNTHPFLGTVSPQSGLSSSLISSHSHIDVVEQRNPIINEYL